MKPIIDIMRKVGEPIVPALFKSARDTDPATSHKAAAANHKGRRIGKKSQAGKMLVEFAKAVPITYIGPVGGMALTSYEAADRAGLTDESKRRCPWRRAKDLLDMGLIRTLGERYDEGTGKFVTTYTITDDGTKIVNEWSKDVE